MHEQFIQYLKDHWISMAISMASSIVVLIITIVTLYTNFRLDYFALKQQVAGEAVNGKTITTTQQQLLQKVTQIDQKVSDDHQQIQTIDNNIEDIHRYFFNTKQ